jgi:hypothetical protein
MLIKQIVERLIEFYPLTPMQQDEHSFSSWFVPIEDTLPLTLCWDDNAKGMSCITALGRLMPGADARVALQLMTLNVIMVAYQGPRFSYSKSSDMLTLIDFINISLIESDNIYKINEMVDGLIHKGRQVLHYLEAERMKLEDTQEKI